MSSKQAHYSHGPTVCCLIITPHIKNTHRGMQDIFFFWITIILEIDDNYQMMRLQNEHTCTCVLYQSHKKSILGQVAPEGI